jgi:hypothetical protein
MIVLGPLAILQYMWWVRRGRERTTWQYLLQKQSNKTQRKNKLEHKIKHKAFESF